MPTTNAPDLRVDETVGRLVAVIRDSHRTCVRALRDCIGDLEDGQPPMLHRYELALRAHHERTFATLAREQITRFAGVDDLVEIIQNAAVDYENRATSHGPVGIEWAAARAATRRVVIEVTQAMQS